MLRGASCRELTFKTLVVGICFWDLKLLPVGQCPLALHSAEIDPMEVSVYHGRVGRMGGQGLSGLYSDLRGGRNSEGRGLKPCFWDDMRLF